MLHQNVVLRPIIRRRLKDVHKLFARKTVKSCIIINPGTAVKIPSVVVDRVGTVSQSRKCGRRTFADLAFELGLIWILSRPKIAHIHSCQHFKFRICCSRPH